MLTRLLLGVVVCLENFVNLSFKLFFSFNPEDTKPYQGCLFWFTTGIILMGLGFFGGLFSFPLSISSDPF